MFRTICVGLLVALVSSVYCLDEESAKEKKCFEVKKTMPVDMQWMATLKTIYYPLMSRLDLYRTAVSVSKRDFKDISEGELYYDGCFKAVFTPQGDFEGVGFNGIRAKFSIKPEDPGLEKFQFGEEGGFVGNCHTTLTDNKSFIFLACCSGGDEMHWVALSSEKALPKKTVKIVHEHAESLGFSRQQFTSLRYDSCDKKDNKDEL